MKAEPGTELACRAHDSVFEEDGQQIQRGVISYYATQTILQAETFDQWRDLIKARATEDVHSGRLQPLYRFSLQVIGTGTTSVPGRPHQ